MPPLPPPPPSSDRAAREGYLRVHAIDIYDRLTYSRRNFARVDELCRRAAAAFPDLLPSDSALAEEAPRLQKDKRGLEIDQGLFLSAVLADPVAGTHLCHAMLLPHPSTPARLAEFERRGELDLGGARVQREGRAALVTMQNPRYLNAEDESTLEPLEIAIDIALLDTKSEICILRGGPVSHPRHAGKRLFGAGINLTHLYQGKIRYLWYILRDLGLVNKLYRGVALPDICPEVDCREKLWIGAIEGFAIGGHCQTVLTLDYVLAAADAYMTLPARKEGIIPGAANLRMSRFVGARLARQAVLAELRIDCASPEGRLVCDEIVPPQEMDAAVARTVEKLTGSGVVSAAGNRRAFRISEEPLDSFRRYMSVYAREQAQCHFSPALIANLERNWNAASRRA
jgi:(3,5-dihydroxyphenyl)acetyl-CoA 1,2-dioxygenase